MSLMPSVPDWVPWWAQMVVLIVAILFGFAFLMMPFAVFGLKGRLDFLETQLEDIQAELRMVATRLPDPGRIAAREPVFEEVPRQAVFRAPSPVQTPVQTTAPASVLSPLRAPPVATARPAPVAVAPDPYRPGVRAQTPPRFGDEAAEPRRLASASPPRRPFPRDDQFDQTPQGPASQGQVSGDWDDQEAIPAQRPLRATTLRAIERQPGRELEEEPRRQPFRESGRSEPTLRWPPR